MDPPREPNHCHQNVVSSFPHGWLWWKRHLTSAPMTEFIERTVRLPLQQPLPHDRQSTTAGPLMPRPPEGVCLTQESQATEIMVTETRADPVWTTRLTNIWLKKRPHEWPSLVVGLVFLLLLTYLPLVNLEGSDDLFRLAAKSNVFHTSTLPEDLPNF